jgi:hypothetical protein
LNGALTVRMRKVLDEDLASFNQLLARKKVPGVFRETAKGKPET